MKKSSASEQNRARQSGVGRIATASAPTVTGPKGVKLPPARKSEPMRLLEEHFPDSEAHTVSFEYFSPAAREVQVAGSFNGWNTLATPMVKQRGGKWSAQLLLKPGQYEYRLVVDGQWQDDPMAARFVANPFGGLNCVVEVKPMMTVSTSESLQDEA